MAIKFKKQIARTPSGNLVTPEEKITTAQLNAVTVNVVQVIAQQLFKNYVVK